MNCVIKLLQSCLVKHLFVRTLALVVLPVCIYLGIFYIHLSLLTKAGPHDTAMTSAFQASLEVHFLKTIFSSAQNRECAFVPYLPR